MQSTFTVRGVKVRTASQRRFVVVACRPEDFLGRRWNGAENGYVPAAFTAFAPVIVRRSDSFETARAAAAKYGFVPGGFVTVVDTTTGEEVTR